MKCALLVALCLAFFSAVNASYGYGYGYPAGAAYPAGAKGLVTYPNGATVPVEPYPVQAARAAHLSAKAATYAAYGAPAYGYAGPAVAYGYGH
ncbi:hypothetical protein TCAL_16362 [Tigriopus californicus]|uniref:Uncharacterized protein n=1 Tax=Tigriopus californicus TaxID=6832 RepID=A0A553NZ53_TIGCA|nr:hypothetical protein TCAL_04453 [Tigriopus californicus]TRY70710.1 hypothetical protein TCAL_16362 [Tigriopus californicus]|eukprot:TCALIF_04453-PA protein Name:"Protein of unknown function" AED:0.00 eAED:0.00 QI:104/1/1/1/1/1/2/172/92